MTGKVVSGKSRGTKIGFPTANLEFLNGIRPSHGVYGSKVLVDGRIFDSVTNIGTNPTFDGGKSETVEVHILNFDGRNIYNSNLHLRFLFRIRDEKKFSSVENLKTAIRRDISYYFSRVKD